MLPVGTTCHPKPTTTQAPVMCRSRAPQSCVPEQEHRRPATGLFDVRTVPTPRPAAAATRSQGGRGHDGQTRRRIHVGGITIMKGSRVGLQDRGPMGMVQCHAVSVGFGQRSAGQSLWRLTHDCAARVGRASA